MNNKNVFTGIGQLLTILHVFIMTLTLSSQNNVEVIGQVKITGGSPGMGKVLTSDNTGLATWQDPANADNHFASIYNLNPQVVAIESDVLFDTNGSLTTGFTHILNSSQIIIANAGYYRVHFSVSATEPNQFALFLNGSAIPGSIFGSGAGTQQNNGQVVFMASTGDIITLRNHTSASAVILDSVVGGTQMNTNASLMIEKL